ncbi:unnamed protein product [Vitrella brassicaformis CCMP3155]|uniref:Uncharacterized protein n=2 Tax=Vitrella brassicaformis TaxID=1169539 RepID=A0A0G4ESX7_VITBC|nr:unnamed protein product [Vitrella brassicaformis CCMP3155]|eukprot:CEM01516.1 unnamed protein product [Vitrella brassicaformis CCMP3155]
MDVEELFRSRSLSGRRLGRILRYISERPHLADTARLTHLLQSWTSAINTEGAAAAATTFCTDDAAQLFGCLPSLMELESDELCVRLANLRTQLSAARHYSLHRLLREVPSAMGLSGNTSAWRLYGHVVQHRMAPLMQELLDHPVYKSDPHGAKERAIRLMHKMKQASQRKEDFADLSTLYGYTALKFTERSLLVFQTLRTALSLSLPMPLPPPASSDHPAGDNHAAPVLLVVSIGGGPGNDVYGFILFWELMIGQPPPSSNGCVSLYVFDLVEEWRAIVDRVAEVSGWQILFGLCDVCEALLGGTEEPCVNRELREVCESATGPSLFLFSFVLFESQSWRTFLSQLWDTAPGGSLFYFADGSQQEMRKIVEAFPECVEGESMWRVHQALLVVKR